MIKNKAPYIKIIIKIYLKKIEMFFAWEASRRKCLLWTVLEGGEEYEPIGVSFLKKMKKQLIDLSALLKR